MGTHLVCDIDKGLGIVPREVFDHLNLIVVQENRCDKGDTPIRGKGRTDQLFPGQVFAVHEEVVELMNG